jgi:hypothetical protein
MPMTFDNTLREMTQSVRLNLTVSEAILPKFFGLLQSGFAVKAKTGVTVKAFLCNQIGLSETYVDERIQTLFLDFKAVDDADRAFIQDGSRLALSAAMPGVAGALFRKGGRYRAMRKGISHGAEDDFLDRKSGWVTIKLFNLVLRELGSFFLSRGVRLDGRQVQHFFNSAPEGLLEKIMKVELNENDIEVNALFNQAWSEKIVLTKVIAA